MAAESQALSSWVSFLIDKDLSKSFASLRTSYAASIGDRTVLNGRSDEYLALYWRARERSEKQDHLSHLEDKHTDKPWPISLFCAVRDGKRALGQPHTFKKCWFEFSQLLSREALRELRVRDRCLDAYRSSGASVDFASTRTDPVLRGGRRRARNSRFVEQKPARRLAAHRRTQSLVEVKRTVATINGLIQRGDGLDRNQLHQKLVALRRSVGEDVWFSRATRKRLVAIQSYLSKCE